MARLSTLLLGLSVVGVMIAAPTSAFANTWSLQSPVAPEVGVESRIEDVSCPSASMCMAVGENKTRSDGFAEIWKEGAWSLVPVSIESPLKSISCATEKMCLVMAKGEAHAWRLRWYEIGSIHHWALSLQNPVLPGGAAAVHLGAVSCPSESSCTAVGAYHLSGKWYTLAEIWSGATEAWRRQVSETPVSWEESAQEAMLSVSCASETSCFSVGTVAGRPYAMRVSGGEWVHEEIGKPSGATFATLEHLSCTTTTSCLAVGHLDESGTKDKTLAERWNGTEWQVTPTPSVVAKGNVDLRGISCTSPYSCMASGSYVSKLSAGGVAEEELTLAESWNGTSWTLQSTLNPAGSKFDSLPAVSCGGLSECTAVGATSATSAIEGVAPLAERGE
jgi:hypothetical protein